MKIAGSSSLLRNVHFEVPTSGGELSLKNPLGVIDWILEPQLFLKFYYDFRFFKKPQRPQLAK